MAVSTGQLERDLREVIAALDRRVGRVEQEGEVSVARDAAALRAEAVERLADLTDQEASEPPAAGNRPPPGAPDE